MGYCKNIRTGHFDHLHVSLDALDKMVVEISVGIRCFVEYASFVCCCKFVMGNGKRTRFWDDNWLGGDVLRVLRWCSTC